MAEGFDKADVVVGEVEVRPARADERRRWDALMAERHYLGFRQFAGRGLRHVAVWRGHWLALVGWQSGAFKCAPRDRWLVRHRSVQFRRLHLIANNTWFRGGATTRRTGCRWAARKASHGTTAATRTRTTARRRCSCERCARTRVRGWRTGRSGRAGRRRCATRARNCVRCAGCSRRRPTAAAARAASTAPRPWLACGSAARTATRTAPTSRP